MTSHQSQIDRAALQFYADNGVSVLLGDEPRDYYAPPELVAPVTPMPSAGLSNIVQAASKTMAAPPVLGASDARNEAVKLAKAATTLDELREAIQEFDGIALKKTASNMVFSSGNAEAPIMLIGNAPMTEDDRTGECFLGENGALLDKILACIGIDRGAEDAAKSIYLTNILNWRPPGNRSPSVGEIEASLPFIERHIQLIQPKILVLCGGVTAKALLGRSESISRLRGTWHDYTPQSKELASDAAPIPTIATFSPANLLKTPTQKRGMWADMITLQKQREALELL